MDVYKVSEIPRPRYLAPGSREWLAEMEGPRLLVRLVDEVHASQVGEMTPTQARCAAMLLDRFAPTMSAVHHTVEGQLAKMTEAELLAEIARVTQQALPSPKDDPEDDDGAAPVEVDTNPPPKTPKAGESEPLDDYPSGKGKKLGSRKNRH